MVHLLHDISFGTLKKLNVIIEIPKGSKIKYELDNESGIIKVDRILTSSVAYPGNYGFIPQTISEDNDPLDVLVLSQGSFPPGVLVECRPIGVLYVIDGGITDYKILCVPISDPYFKNISDLTDLSSEMKVEIEDFFKTYKRLERKKIELKSTRKRAFAESIIKRAVEKYQNVTFKKAKL